MRWQDPCTTVPFTLDTHLTNLIHLEHYLSRRQYSIIGYNRKTSKLSDWTVASDKIPHILTASLSIPLEQCALWSP